jgi:CelD/BcsL family acetyltransferase involved in cellulose biosynthesis
MEFKLLSTQEDWNEIKHDWDALLNESITPSPFLSHAYLSHWWQSAGGGEWKAFDRQLCIIAAFENGKLLGIAPLFAWRNTKTDTWQLGFIGQVEVSDYLDIIVREENLHRFLTGLLDFIQNANELPGKKMVLANIIDTSPTVQTLTQLAQEKSWKIESEVLEVAPYIRLAQNFEAYLAQIDKKQRHEIRRKLRNAQNNAKVELQFVNQLERLEENIAHFIHLMGQDAGKAQFLNPDMVAFFEGFIQNSFAQGNLVFTWLSIDGQHASGYLSLIQNDTLYVYNSCWDLAFASYSPGWVHLSLLIDWAISQKLSEVDMMRGDEIYKYRFGGIDRKVLQICFKPG